MLTMTCSLNLDEADFQRFASTAMEWGESWRVQADRFECTDMCTNTGYYGTEHHDPLWTWKFAYWIGDVWANIVLARTFLEAIDEDYEIFWDLAENPNAQYVILTNYADLSLQARDKRFKTALWGVRFGDNDVEPQDGDRQRVEEFARSSGNPLMHRDSPDKPWHMATTECK